MTCLPEDFRITYRSKDNRKEKIFDGSVCLATITSHMPDLREKMFLYYAFHSNVSKGIRQKENQEFLIPSFIKLERTKSSNLTIGRLADFRPSKAGLLGEIKALELSTPV